MRTTFLLLVLVVVVGGCKSTEPIPPPSPQAERTLSAAERAALEGGRRYDPDEILRQLQSADSRFMSVDQVMYYHDDSRGAFSLSFHVIKARTEPVPAGRWQQHPPPYDGALYYLSDDGRHFRGGSGSVLGPNQLVLTPRATAP